MGFSLEHFLNELEYMVSHCASHMEILEFIQNMKQYAKECGDLK